MKCCKCFRLNELNEIVGNVSVTVSITGSSVIETSVITFRGVVKLSGVPQVPPLPGVVPVPHHQRRLAAPLEEERDTNKAVVEDLCQTHKAEAHTQSQQPPGAGDVGDSAHLLRLAEPLAVWLLDEDVDDRQVAFGVVVYL